MGARRDAHTHESGLRPKFTPPECAMAASSVAPEILEKVADVRLANSSISASTTFAINALKEAGARRLDVPRGVFETAENAHFTKQAAS